MSLWTCNDCYYDFIFIIQGTETRPNECPRCHSKNVEVREM
jgi:ABC-type ATPase with predicted acetyltransferase domain